MPSVSNRHAWLVVGLAALYAGLNAPKPPQIDDAAYACFARQFATNPLDPYGHWILWYNVPEPLNHILAPPVLPASWGAALRVAGEQTRLCKLLLAPWALLLVWALDRLFRRFAPGLEAPLLVLTVLSPALLPSLNLMLDVPALALTLAAVHLFLVACDRDSFGWAAGAGLVAGVAMQTKYTAFLAPAVMALAAGLYRRRRLAVPAVLAAVQVFAAWEFLTALLYGDSHFLYSVRARDAGSPGKMLEDKAILILPLFGYLGGLLPAVGLLALAALGAPPRRLAAAAAAVLVGLAALASFGSGDWDMWTPDPLAADFVCSLFCLGSGGALVAVARRLLRQGGEDRRDTVFLLLWLGVEVLGYFALSPFPAVRRLLGTAVVLTLLAGRLAARTCAGPRGRRTVWAVTAFGVALGLMVYGVDLREAQVQQTAAQEAAAWVRDHGGGRVWYVGHWGFQFAAEQCGMLPVVGQADWYVPEDGMPPPSRLHRGDWLVEPCDRIHKQPVRLAEVPREFVCTFTFQDPIPLRTLCCFYLGRTPVTRSTGPRLQVDIYRVTADWVPVF
jgi:hypothetical protein